MCLFPNKRSDAGGASPVCLASVRGQIRSDAACCCLSIQPESCSLSDIVSFSVSLFQCSYSFSRTLSPTVHRALLLSLMISGSRVYVCNECLCDWTASGGRLLAPVRTCHIRKRFFSRQGFYHCSDVLRVPSFAQGDPATPL